MLSGNNGILQRAGDAKQTSERAEAKEQAQMDIMDWITDKTANNQNSTLDNAKVKEILIGKSYVKNGQPGNDSFITAKGEYEIPYSELYTESNTKQTTSIPAGTYTVGQEIVYNGTQFVNLTSENSNIGEHFYVVADDGDSVKLLAKYCLNQEGTFQTDKNATRSIYGRRFSQTNYWSDNFTSSPFDLQSNAMIEEAEDDGTTIQNAVLTARAYGDTKGVIGRLMTKGEADTLAYISGPLASKIMMGTWDDDSRPVERLNWWLGDAEYSSGVWFVIEVSGFDSAEYSANYGVRPVLVVPKL